MSNLTEADGPIGWPWPLKKAAHDHYVYTIGLRDGSVVRFTECHTCRDPAWVTIDPLDLTVLGPLRAQLNTGDARPVRGLVLRVSEIVWAVDGYE